MKHKNKNTRTFVLPKPMLSRGEQSSKNHVSLGQTSSSKIARQGKRTNPKLRLARPKFKEHICKSEPNCDICRDYVNKLQEWRDRYHSIKIQKKYGVLIL